MQVVVVAVRQVVVAGNDLLRQSAGNIVPGLVNLSTSKE